MTKMHHENWTWGKTRKQLLFSYHFKGKLRSHDQMVLIITNNQNFDKTTDYKWSRRNRKKTFGKSSTWNPWSYKNKWQEKFLQTEIIFRKSPVRSTLNGSVFSYTACETVPSHWSKNFVRKCISRQEISHSISAGATGYHWVFPTVTDPNTDFFQKTLPLSLPFLSSFWQKPWGSLCTLAQLVLSEKCAELESEGGYPWMFQTSCNINIYPWPMPTYEFSQVPIYTARATRVVFTCIDFADISLSVLQNGVRSQMDHNDTTRWSTWAIQKLRSPKEEIELFCFFLRERFVWPTNISFLQGKSVGMCTAGVLETGVRRAA